MKLAALALAAMSTWACAQERLEFKGVPLGATMEEFKAKNQHFWCTENSCYIDGFNPTGHCSLLNRMTALRVATQECIDDVRKSATYANQRATLFATFRNGTLAKGDARFEPSAFAEIVEAITLRFGNPLKQSTETVQNRAGAVFQNIIVQWSVGGDTLWVRKYGSTVDRGAVIVMDQAEARRIEDVLEKRRKTAPGDL